MSNKSLNTICDLKWNYPIFNLKRGEFRSCCRTPSVKITEEAINAKGIDAFLNSDEQRKSRLDLINGIKNKDCQSCWNLEEKGIRSPRHDAKQFWKHLKSSHVIDANEEYSEEKFINLVNSVETFDNKITESYNPYMLEINMGNTCDMKCIYCNHHYSSQWGTELVKWGEITENRLNEEFPVAPSNFDEAFWQWFNQVGRYSLGRIGIIGGEPLIMPEFYVLLDKLQNSIEEIKHERKTKPTLWVVTNMNTPANYLSKFIDYLPKVSELFNVSIYVSAESIGARAEYIRNGVDWEKFERNINQILTLRKEKNLSFSFNFMPTVNILSIVGKLDFVKFVENLIRKYQLPIGITQNIVSFPEWQSPMILTEDFAEYLDKTVTYIRSVTDIPEVSDKLATWSSYATFLENLSSSIRTNNEDVTRKRKKFKEWFDTLDFRRRQNLLDIFPEYKEFYNLCASQ